MNELTKALFDVLLSENFDEKKFNAIMASHQQLKAAGLDTLCLDVNVKRDVKIDEKVTWDLTLLGTALHNKNLIAVKALVAAGASVDGPGAVSQLWYATARKFIPAIEFLIEHDADINLIFPKGNPEIPAPLHLATWNGTYEIATVLLLNHADIDLKSNKNETALEIAKRRKHEKIEKLLIAANLLREAQAYFKDSKVLQAQACFMQALATDYAYITAFLAKVAKVVVETENSAKEVEVDAREYLPEFLRFALLLMKPTWKHYAALIAEADKQQLEKLILHITSYTVPDAEHQAKAVFKTLKEKNGVLKSLVKGTQVEKSFNAMAALPQLSVLFKAETSQADLMAATGSPIVGRAEKPEKASDEQLAKEKTAIENAP